MRLRNELYEIAKKNDISANMLDIVLGHIYLYQDLESLFDVFQPAELMEITRVFCYFDHEEDQTIIKPEYLPLFDTDLWLNLAAHLKIEHGFTYEGPPNHKVSKMYVRSKEADTVLTRLFLKKVKIETMAIAISKAYATFNPLPLEKVVTSQLETLLLFSSNREVERFDGLV